MDKRRRAKKSVLVMIAMIALLVSAQAAQAGWTDVTPENSTKILYGIWGTSPSNIYAVGQDGAILHYDGTAWTAETSGTTEKLNAVWGLSETNIYVVGENGTLLHKTAAGTTWGAEPLVDYKDQNDFNNTDLYSVRGSSTSNIFLGSINGWFIRFDGTGWTAYDPEPPTGSSKIAGIWVFSSTNLYCTTAAGSYGRLFHYDGEKWEQQYGGDENIALYSIWGNTPSDIYVAGSTGLILQSNGTSWLGVSSGTTQKLYSVFGSSASNIFAVGVQGTIVHNKGAGFIAENFNTTSDLFGVWTSSDGSVAYAVGTDGMILKYTPDPITTTTTVSGNTTTTTPGGTTTTIPGGNTTTTIPGGTTTTIPGTVTTSIVPPGEVGADFIGSPLAGRVGMQVQFTNLSGGDITSYSWNFGDGGVSIEKNPSHVYQKRGTYSVILTVTGGDNNSKTAQKMRENYITVKSRCAIIASVDSHSQIETLRAARDASLDDLPVMLLTSIYYQDTAEISALLDEKPAFRARLKSLVNDNIGVAEALLQGIPATLSSEALADVLDYLEEIKASGSIKLQNDIDFVIVCVRSGLLLKGMGITIE
jgi:PKD repeat protein